MSRKRILRSPVRPAAAFAGGGTGRARAGPGSLWATLVRRERRARRIGALLPVDTECTLIEDGGVCFVVRVASSLARKDDAARNRARTPVRTPVRTDPFLPFEKDLFVADLSDSHVALLNKFSVVERHLLIVTRAYEDQEMFLTPGDFQALWHCLTEYDGLGFYNGGAAAGASQPHKHLQVVPIPLGEGGPPVPIEAVFGDSVPRASVVSLPSLPFRHSFLALNASYWKSPRDAGRRIWDRYRALLVHAGLKAPGSRRPERQSGPYCFLMTRRWMLLIPRSREGQEGISINALGFAGTLFVRNAKQLRRLIRSGPMTVLRAVSRP